MLGLLVSRHRRLRFKPRMKCVVLGVVNIGISSIGSICKQWKGYLVASSIKWMLAWGWQPSCIHTTQTEVRVEVWVYCDGNVASGGFWGASYVTASVWILLFCRSSWHHLSPAQFAQKLCCIKDFVTWDTNKFFHLFFFFHLSIVKRLCYISCIQKFSWKKKAEVELLDKVA